MLIWFAALIPLVGAGALYWIWHHKVVLWEAGLMMAVPIALIACAKGCSEYSQTHDTEYWGGYVTTAEYYEDWDEMVPCCHPIYQTRTDANGNTTQVYVGNEHLYDVNYHPERWQVNSSVGESFNVSRGTFENLSIQFGSRVFVELHRAYHTNDGDKYVATWKGEAEKLEPVTVARSYENRVQASQSVFNFKEVSPLDYGLFQYPPIEGFSQRVTHGPGATAPVEKKFQYLNATLGAPRQIRLYVLVFQGQPIQAAMEQEALWKRGNKNEFVTCVGVDKNLAVQWAHVFSWTEVEELKIEARNRIMEMKTLDLSVYADWLKPAIEQKWRRKNFDDFNYLSVEPTTTAVIWTYVVTLLATAGIGIWAIMNQFEPDSGFGVRRSFGYYFSGRK